MSSSTCPHGLSRDTCQICRVLEPSAVPAARSGRNAARRRGGLPGNLAVLAVVAVVAVVVVGGLATAALFAVVRIIELIAVAAIAGWAGWKLGVRRGRRRG